MIRCREMKETGKRGSVWTAEEGIQERCKGGRLQNKHYREKSRQLKQKYKKKTKRGEKKTRRQRQTLTVTPVFLISQSEPSNHVWPQTLNSSCPLFPLLLISPHLPLAYSSLHYFCFSTLDFFHTILPPAISLLSPSSSYKAPSKSHYATATSLSLYVY